MQHSEARNACLPCLPALVCECTVCPAVYTTSGQTNLTKGRIVAAKSNRKSNSICEICCEYVVRFVAQHIAQRIRNKSHKSNLTKSNFCEIRRHVDSHVPIPVPKVPLSFVTKQLTMDGRGRCRGRSRGLYYRHSVA